VARARFEAFGSRFFLEAGGQGGQGGQGTKSSKLGRKVPMAAMAPKSTAKSLGATMHPWLLWLGTPNFLKNAGLRRVDTGGEAMPAMPHGFAFVMCASRIF